MQPRKACRVGDRDRVLVVRLGAVGDVLRTLPAVHLLRRSVPSARISWIVEDPSRPLLDAHPDVDEVLRFPRRELVAATLRPWRLPGVVRALRDALRAGRFDVALDFQGSLKSALVACLSGAGTRIGFGPGHAREMGHLFTTHHVRPPGRRINRVEKALALVEAAGARGDEITVPLPERAEEAAEAQAILARLAPAREPVVILSPGTSRLQRYKRWPAERYGAVAAALRRDSGAVPVISWGPGEDGLGRAAVAASEGAAVAAPRTSLRVLAALLRRAALFVGADTGPMHLAWAVGCPVVALFGPTDPALNAPLGTQHVVLRPGRTMAAVTVDEVVRAARVILGRPAAERVAPVFERRALPLPAGAQP